MSWVDVSDVENREGKEVADRIEGVACGFLAAWRTLDGLKRAAKLREER
jgi:hypothetical protein